MKRSIGTFQISDYVDEFASIFPGYALETLWQIVPNIQTIVQTKIRQLSSEFRIKGAVAIHKTAVVEEHAILKGPLIISADCFVAAHAYLRGGVFLAPKVSLGPGCEIKSSLLFSRTALAHLNFAGDSIIGSDVNLEAGAVIANCYNEREYKAIFVKIGTRKVDTGLQKFGALVGDETKIGANAVLSPGTLLKPSSIVGRLQLVEQLKGRE